MAATSNFAAQSFASAIRSRSTCRRISDVMPVGGRSCCCRLTAKSRTVLTQSAGVSGNTTAARRRLLDLRDDEHE